jgi:hypothetical protein
VNTAVKAPALTSESVLRLVRDAGPDGTTLGLLAEDLDLPATSITLRLTVAALVGEGRIRWSGDRLVVKR